MITIRPVDPQADAAQIAEIYSYYVSDTAVSFETVPPTVDEMAARLTEITARFPCFAAVDPEENIVGYCYAHPWKERAAYGQTLETTVYLRRNYSGQGVGTLLMQRLIEECKICGYRSLIACITASNVSSREFHTRLGFNQVSDFKDVGFKFGRWLDVTDYQLML